MSTIKDLLNDEIKVELEKLGKMNVGSDEYQVAVDGLTKLVDRSYELEKIEIDVEKDKKRLELDKEKNNLEKEKLELEKGKLEMEKINKTLDRDQDKNIKLEQLKDTKTDQIIRNVISGLGILLPIMVTIWGTNKTLKFEETGTVTTMMGRGFINKMLPKK